MYEEICEYFFQLKRHGFRHLEAVKKAQTDGSNVQQAHDARQPRLGHTCLVKVFLAAEEAQVEAQRSSRCRRPLTTTSVTHSTRHRILL